MENSLWYEQNPQLLESEKSSMKQLYPDFELNILDDGRICWIGEISPLIRISDKLPWNKHIVMILYATNHPNLFMGSSVRLYPLIPDVEDLRAGLGGLIYCRSDDNPINLCSQACKDSIDNEFWGVWIHRKAFPDKAVQTLQLYSIMLTFLEMSYLDRDRSIKHFCNTHPDITSKILRFYKLIEPSFSDDPFIR